MACGSLGAIARACGNRGTASEVIAAWYADIEEVANIPAAASHVISSDITFNVDGHFYPIAIDKVGSSYSFVTEGEGDSKEYVNTVILFVAGVAAAASNIISGLIRGNYLLIIKDKNLVQHVIGAEEDGAQVGNQVQNSRNGYIITWTWRSKDLPFNYTGAITTE